MSLVSVITNRGFPIIISDRAVSKSQGNETTHITSLNLEINLHEYSSYRSVYSYVLKTLIVQEVLCVGFVGVMDDLEEVHSNLLDFFMHREVKAETLSEFLKEYDLNAYTESGFIFILRLTLPENHLQIGKFGKWCQEVHPFFETMFSGGTGAKTWNNGIINSTNYLEINEFFDPVSSLNLSLYNVMRYLIEEKRSPDNLIDGWGGGFDIIYFSEGKFQRLDNIGFAFWQVDIGKSREIKLHSIIHNSYDGEDLIIRNFGLDEHKTYLVSQINCKKKEIKKSSMFFQANRVVSCITVVNGDELISDLFCFSTHEDDEPQFHTKEINGNLAFGFSISYSNSLEKALRNFQD